MDRKHPPVNKNSYVINFTFKGRKCREYLPIKVSAANDKWVINRTIEIRSRIKNGTFIYTDYFPNSESAKFFSAIPSSQTLSQAAEDWKKSSEDKYPESTFKTYKKDLNLVLNDLGDYLVRDLVENHSILIDWYNKQTTTKKTVLNKFCPLRRVFDMVSAKSNGQIKNPVKEIDWTLFGSNLKKSTKKEIDVFTPDEIELILSKCNDWEKNYWEFAFFTGMRTGELWGLRWSDNLSVQRTIIPRTGGRSKSPKTKAGLRTIKPHPRALEAYERQKERTGLTGDTVFINPAKGKGFEDYEETRNSLVRLCKLAKVRFRPQYNTRHSFASNMLTAGVNIEFISQQMGHQNSIITRTTYARWVVSDDDVNQWDKISKRGAKGFRNNIKSIND